MSEPIKKPMRTPESYNPKKPEIINMMNEAENDILKQIKTESGLTEETTKNSIDYPFRFSGFMELEFINCFTSVFLQLEGIQGDKEQLGKRQWSQYFLFDTLCGRNSLRYPLDGVPSAILKQFVPTEIQKRIGTTPGYENSTDYTVDFLYGFAGYEYRKLTDPGDFKAAITASVNAGKAVIAKTKIEKGVSWGGIFRVISGYDGDKLIEPSYEDIGHNRPNKSVVYGEIDELFIVGEKIPVRYTLRDGLERIKLVMECNKCEKPWDNVMEKLVNLRDADNDEKKACMRALEHIGWNMKTYAFFEGFCSDPPIYDELKNPAFDALKKQISKLGEIVHDLDGALIGIAQGADFEHRAYGSGYLYLAVDLVIERKKKHEDDLYDIVLQMIEILDLDKEKENRK